MFQASIIPVTMKRKNKFQWKQRCVQLVVAEEEEEEEEEEVVVVVGSIIGPHEQCSN